jgi:NAD(P)H-hydrate epimerase
MPDDHDPLPLWGPRDPNTHKGNYGRVLVVGGALGFTGAPALAALAALRGGCGLCTVAVPEPHRVVVASHALEPMVQGLAANGDGTFAAAAFADLERLASTADVVCLGPGMSHHPDVVALVRRLVAAIACPLVIDADGLNALAGDTAVLAQRTHAPTILTPHPGEMARLCGTDTAAIQGARSRFAREFASAHGVVVALKGYATVVTDGHEPWICGSGNPGMATAGTGDVLAGLVAALVAQGFPPDAATRMGVWIHGRAGDLAVERTGEVSMVASDVIGALPEAICEYQQLGGRPPGPIDEASLGGGEIR